MSGAIAQGPSLTGRRKAQAARRSLEGHTRPQSPPQAEAAEAEAEAPMLCDPTGHGGKGGEDHELESRCVSPPKPATVCYKPVTMSTGKAHELRCAAGSHAVGAFGSYSLVLDSLGLICSDGSRTAKAGGGDAASGEQPKRWRFVCAGWRLCEDEEAQCAEWAAAGECEANPGWMDLHCAWSCGGCDEEGALMSAPRAGEAAERVVGLEVRAGDLVDAVRVRCSGSQAKAAAAEEEETETVKPVDSEAVEVAESSSSAWFGGDGGALCELACGNGTALHGLSVRAGGRVDRIELGACEGEGQRRPGAWGGAKAEEKARDEANETTRTAEVEAEKEDTDGVEDKDDDDAEEEEKDEL